MATHFTARSFLVRVAAAAALVFATYNPLEHLSYYSWAIAPALGNLSAFTPFQGLVGIILLIGWAVLIRATKNSLGLFGILLGVALCVMVVWVMFDQGWIRLGENHLLAWLLLTSLSVLLGTGLSWSHIRRRISGQLDVDEVDTE